MSKTAPQVRFARVALALSVSVAGLAYSDIALADQASDAAQTGGLEEIIVTAQKREQSIQSVPVAVTALTGTTLVNNRVFSVTDLTGLAPGMSVRPAAGGSQIPSFSMRGVTSYGVVPGSDKEVSMYIDGVYLSSPRGAIFNLPDIRSIEVLRGPQGTLFGRNATAGAVSISTRDPNGELGAELDLTVGNYAQNRERLTVSTPQIGAFSAYATYVRDFRHGDTINSAAGTVWDRTASGLGIGVSPKYLGSRNANSLFLAVKFAPTDNFKMVYKYDHDVENNTPEATALIAVNTGAPLTGALIAAVTTGLPLASDGKRPSVVSNSFAVPTRQKIDGHNLTATWDASDSITIKNVAAYRKTYQFAAVPIDGFSGLPFNAAAVVPYATLSAFSRFPPNAANGFSTAGAIAAIPGFAAFFGTQVGQRFLGIASQPQSTSEQWSDELQLNYRSKLVTLTAGALWFHGKDSVGGPDGLQNTFSFVNVPASGVLPLGQYGKSLNKATSLAAFAQAEVHLTEKLDLVLGARITKDDKSGSFNSGTGLAAPTVVIPFTYTKTKPNWLLGVNYTPVDDVLLYAKASTAFVSGGSVAAITFEPEKATSFEAGIKAEWLNRRLRTNLAVYHVQYDNLQTAQGATNFAASLTALGNSLTPPVPNLASIVSTFVVPIGGPVKAKGFELETTALLADGLTIGGNLSYHTTKYSTIDPRILASVTVNGQSQYLPGSLSPSWDGRLWAEVQSKPFANGASVYARVDGNWHGKYLLTSSPDIQPAVLAPYNYAPAAWIINGRVALKDIPLGPVKAELAVWGRNLTQNRDLTYVLNLAGALAGNFQAARTLGLDVKIRY